MSPPVQQVENEASPLQTPNPNSMKRLLLAVVLTLSAITADAQEAIARPHFFDNWSVTLSAGAYHPMCYSMKYLVDCSGAVGAAELRKQVTPALGLGLEANAYYRMSRPERQDPRTVIGLMTHINLMNLFGGYTGRPRLFEIETDVMPAWGRLYRGTGHKLFPDENYFATKFGLSFNFNLGKSRAWALTLKPGMVLDVTSKAPTPGYVTPDYKGYNLKRSDLLVLAGFTYRFRNHDRLRHFHEVAPVVNNDEVERLNESVNFLRSDVEQRDRLINELKQKIEQLEQQQNPQNPTITLP